jgi:glutamate-1-semialdehyde 2,1-aminomutase
VEVPHVTGLLTVFFSERPVRSYADAQACDMQAYGAFCRALLELGVYPPASQYEAWFPSLAHTAEHVERTVEAARTAFARV